MQVSRKLFQYCIDIFFDIGNLAALASVVTAGAIAFWVSVFLVSPDHPYIGGSVFTLAQVMAIFGAFGVAAAFSSYHDCELKLQLRRAGVLHLVSALGFTLWGLIFPISTYENVWARYENTLLILNGGAIFMGMVGFSWGTMMWVGQLPKLLALGSNRTSCPEIDSRSNEC